MYLGSPICSVAQKLSSDSKLGNHRVTLFVYSLRHHFPLLAVFQHLKNVVSCVLFNFIVV